MSDYENGSDYPDFFCWRDPADGSWWRVVWEHELQLGRDYRMIDGDWHELDEAMTREWQGKDGWGWKPKQETES
jgi:hypothetical protein